MKDFYLIIHTTSKGYTGELVPYDEVLGCKNSIINTNCLSFFQFDYLERFKDVIIVRDDKYISLGELLKGRGGYTRKYMRRAHNAYKMFVANAFNLKEGDYREMIHTFGYLYIGEKIELVKMEEG